ncbi:hypothetical protein ASPZODRAFT_61739 [Penicilliopsis zonata CBS 506.65]|uniref:GTP-binding protein EsdC n=1 Tax=Penicilliopsis zonata CBS 506.65 TaxID=1073090 RepID=A0A1L9SLY5_9EURO|nr:hypothetical protein ASPZODRAFT_61739 [Penicilliopsis zonata CBS 506.65]OJJ48116.1 hypothetical protein ASPZODRAFT_61739 [Penicilliopsis zonata CBS 506.65]
MSAVQLKFSLRTSPNVKTVHLVGSWDNYSRQLPLSQDSSKAGAWAGTFRFQTSMLRLGSRYWYYYIMDGYHVSHDPAVEYTVEPTTGRKLNILNVPKASPKQPPPISTSMGSSRSSVPKGRALSPSRIRHPRPSRPYASRSLREGSFSSSNMDDLTRQFDSSRLSDEDDSSITSSLSSRSSRGSSSPSSVSSSSDPPTPISPCRCERYGITRKGDRVKLDCGGARCGYDDESDICSESDDDIDRSRRSHRPVIRVRR